MPLMNPVPVFDFNVFMMDAKPGSIGLADLPGFATGIGKSVLFGSFAEASGLNAELEIEEYWEGGNNVGPHKFGKAGKFSNLIFKRGVTMNPDIWDWYYEVVYKTKNPTRKNGFILLTDRGTGISAAAGGPTPLGLAVVDRLPIAMWYFRNALPVKLQGPGLNAKSNEIAIETLEIAPEALYRFGPSMVPRVGDIADALGL
jgi:phage tail-like protein